MDQNCKYKCQIFTPEKNVNELLDWCGYKNNLYGKKVLENSCGDGQILTKIIERYIQDSIKNNILKKNIKMGLEKDIYGIELDPKHFNKCKENIDNIAKKFNINNVNWNLYCEDSLKKSFDFSFDFIIGNPPYINYRDLDEETRKYVNENFAVCQKGKFDYCYAFIEKGINCLSDNGRMCYLIPGSIFKNVFSHKLREYMLPHLLEIHDYDKEKLFKRDGNNKSRNILTSSAVIVLEKESNKTNIVYTNETSKKKFSIAKKNLGNKWVFNSPKFQNNRNNRFGDYFKVSNSIATLLNSAYVINNWKDNNKYICVDNYKIEKAILKSAVSPRTLNSYKNEKIIFPYTYDEDNRLLKYSEKEFKSKYPKAYNYLFSKKGDLDKRKSDTSAKWFEYGRSQALNDMNKEKLLISIVITKRVKVYELSKDIIPYSGIYIIPKKDKSLKEAKDILESKDFYEYVKNIGINASGDSIRITSSDINNYMF